MYHTRPISHAEKQNFDTLISATRADRICLVSTFDSHQAKTAVMVCAVNHPPDDPESFEFVPLAKLCNGNPYER